jgi:hypothetical protein
LADAVEKVADEPSESSHLSYRGSVFENPEPADINRREAELIAQRGSLKWCGTSWQTAQPLLKVPMGRQESMVRKGRLHCLQNRPREMPAAVEPWRWSLKRLIAISHNLAERLVRIGEGVAPANLDHGGESVGNRR